MMMKKALHKARILQEVVRLVLVRKFKKTANENVVEEVKSVEMNGLTPERFAKLIETNKDMANTKCNLAIYNANVLNDRQAKGIDVVIKLDAMVDMLEELSTLQGYIENAEESNWAAWCKYAGEHQYSLVYDASEMTGPEVLEGYKLRVAELSDQLVKAYTELYKITDGERHMPLVALDCQEVNLHGVLVLIERILKSNDVYDRYKKLETLKYLVKGLVCGAQPYVNVRKKAANDDIVARFNEFVQRSESASCAKVYEEDCSVAAS